MLIDLSHTLERGMPVYPGSNELEIKDLGLYKEYGVFVQQYTLDGHMGTHIDVPAHLFSGRKTTETTELSNFFGSAQVLDCTHFNEKRLLGPDILDQIPSGDWPDFLLLHTGWSRHWGTEDYFKFFPVVSPKLIHILSKSSIKGVGLDTVSLDSVEASDLPNHSEFLTADKIIIENLTNLQCLIGKRFKFSCFPLKIANGDGSPVRAVAILD